MTTTDDIAAAVPGLHVPPLPRRFLLYEYPLLADRPRLYCWGAALRHGVLAFLPDGGHLGMYASATELLRTLRFSRDLRLLWIDPDDSMTARTRAPEPAR